MANIFNEPRTEYVSGLDVPGISEGWDFSTGSDQILDLTKEIIARFIEYIPMIVLVLLLLACVKIIFDGDAKEGGKRIKYILIGVGLMILSVYVVNVISTITTGAPLINIRLHKYF